MRTVFGSSGGGEVNLNTAVLYKWRPFTPSVSSDYLTSEQKSKLLSDAKAYKVLHASSSVNSDLIDFAEYGFDYKIRKNSYGSYLKTNDLDKKSLSLVGNSLSDLEKIESFAIPQLSEEEKDEEEENKFFGCISIDEKSIYMIDLPGEDWEFVDNKKIITKESTKKFYIGDIGYFELVPLTYTKINVNFSDNDLNTDFSSYDLEEIRSIYSEDETISNIQLLDNLLIIQKTDGSIILNILSLKYSEGIGIISAIVKLSNSLKDLFKINYNLNSNMSLDEFYSRTEVNPETGESDFVYEKKGQQSGDVYLYDKETFESYESLLSRGIYKVEFYNTSLEVPEGSKEEDLYIDSEIREYLGLDENNDDATYPIFTVIFGPESSCPNNDPKETSYYKFDNLYYDFDKISDSITDNEILNKYEYSNLIQEITNRKVLCVATNSESSDLSVNLSYSAWKVSKNSNRNQNKYSLRNDFLNITKNGLRVFEDDHGLAIDKNCYVLLGGNGVNIDNTDLYPILSRKYNRCKTNWNNHYHENVVYPISANIVSDLRGWVSNVSGNINENPEYSPFWETTNTDWLITNKDYIEVSISQSKISDSISVSPTGIRSFRKGKDIVFDLNLRGEDNIESYEIKSIEKDGEIIPACDFKIEDDKLTIYNYNSPLETSSLFFNIGKIKSNLNVLWSFKDDYYEEDDNDLQNPKGYSFSVEATSGDISEACVGDNIKVNVYKTNEDEDDWVYSLAGYTLSSEGNEILHEVENNEFSFVLSSKDETISLILEGRTYTVEIIDRVGCEVETELGKVKYGMPFKTKYYVLDGYEDKIFNYVDNNGNIVITDANSKENVTIDWSISSIDEDGYHEFTIERVEKDYLISLKFDER